MTELYGEYINTLATYARTVGLEFSTQLAYGAPLDITGAVGLVDAPEIESCKFASYSAP